MESVATFVTDRFNTTTSKPTFINPGCFGDDLALWLIDELRTDGVRVDAEAVPEDFGWAIAFERDGRWYWAVIGYVPGRVWYIAIERRGFMPMLFRRSRAIPCEVIDTITRVLIRDPDIRSLQWLDARTFFAANRRR